jgi:hypothetical protein
MANEYVIKRGLVVSGSTSVSGSLSIVALSAGSGNIVSIGSGGALQSSGYAINQSLNTSSTPSFAGLTINGNSVITGNLDVQGTVTYLNTTDLIIKDKLIAVASGSATSADADGGGLFISGANASMTWDNGNSRMSFNKPLFVNGAFTATSLAGTGGSITGLNASNLSSGTVSTSLISGLTNTNLSGTAGITNANLANSSVTVGSTAISLGSSATTIAGLVSVTSTGFTGALTGNASTATTLQTARNINGVSFNGSADITVTANTTNALTIGTGLSGTSFNGSAAITVAIDSTVATLTGTQTLTNKTLTSPTINTATIAGGTINNAIIGGSTPVAGTFTTLSANTSITSGGTIAATGAISSTSNASSLTGSFSGSFKGDGSGITGVAASFPTSGPGVINGTTQFYVSNSGLSQYGVFATIATALAGTGLTANGSTGAISVNSGSMATYFRQDAYSNISGDITINSSGVSAIGASKVTNAMLANSTISGIALGSTLAALTAGTYLTSGGTYTGATARTFAVDATDANTASKVVARDASGNFSAGTITAALSGNASIATTATQVGNALTAGTGLLSGGTFTGAAARTFSVDSGSMATYFRQDAYSNVSGDITINSSGVSAIGSGKVTSTMILDGTILNADINASAAIAVSKLAASTISGITLGSNLGTLTLGDGLSGTSYNGSTGVTAAVDSTVVRTTGAQSIAGIKTFTNNVITTADLIISGSGVQGSIIDKQQIGPSVISTLTQVASIAVSGVDAVFFDYVIKQSTTDMRAGTVMVVTNGSAAEFTEVATLDIGNTSTVILTADVNGGNVRLLALSPTGTWTIRTLVRTI